MDAYFFDWLTKVVVMQVLKYRLVQYANKLQGTHLMWEYSTKSWIKWILWTILIDFCLSLEICLTVTITFTCSLKFQQISYPNLNFQLSQLYYEQRYL